MCRKHELQHRPRKMPAARPGARKGNGFRAWSTQRDRFSKHLLCTLPPQLKHHTHTHTHKHKHTNTHTHTNTVTETQIHQDTDKQRERERDRQRERDTHSHTHTRKHKHKHTTRGRPGVGCAVRLPGSHRDARCGQVGGREAGTYPRNPVSIPKRARRHVHVSACMCVPACPPDCLVPPDSVCYTLGFAYSEFTSFYTLALT